MQISGSINWRIENEFAEFDYPFDVPLIIGRHYDDYPRLLEEAGIAFPSLKEDELIEEDLDYEDEAVPPGKVTFYCGAIVRVEPGLPPSAVLAKSQEAMLQWLLSARQADFVELVGCIVESCYSAGLPNGCSGVLDNAPATDGKLPFLYDGRMPPSPPLPAGYKVRDFIRIREINLNAYVLAFGVRVKAAWSARPLGLRFEDEKIRDINDYADPSFRCIEVGDESVSRL